MAYRKAIANQAYCYIQNRNSFLQEAFCGTIYLTTGAYSSDTDIKNAYKLCTPGGCTFKYQNNQTLVSSILLNFTEPPLPSFSACTLLLKR